MKFHMLGTVAHVGYVGSAHDSQAHFNLSPAECAVWHGIEYLHFPLFSVAHSGLLCSTNT